MKVGFSRQILEKYLNIKFNENLSSRIRIVPCGWTDRSDEANSHFSHFFESTSNLNVQHVKQAICGELLKLRNIQQSHLSKIVNIL
jgi:hypothetical protein